MNDAADTYVRNRTCIQTLSEDSPYVISTTSDKDCLKRQTLHHNICDSDSV